MTRSSSKLGPRSKWLKRRGSGSRGFHYLAPDGTKVTDADTLDRINSLVIPPAWRDVRISPYPTAKLQAIGIDARGRRQYKYHPRFVDSQARRKFKRMEVFGQHLQNFREQTNRHIVLEGFPLEKVLAIMTRLINLLYFRVGTDQSARQYRTYGITTLKKRHLTIGKNGELIFDFVGKSQVRHRKVHVDRDLANIMRELSQLNNSPKLFLYAAEEGGYRPVTPIHINQYIKSLTSSECTAKDFRTWGATLMAALELSKLGIATEPATLQKNMVKVVKKVAQELGNTPAVCRVSYIHPAVFRAYQKGQILSQTFSAKPGQVNLRSDETAEKQLLQLLRAF